jgi:Flp pilus assembly pilin Flp
MTLIGAALQAWLPRLAQLFHEEKGQDGVEYAVVAALVIAVVAAAYVVTGGQLTTDISNALAYIAGQIP